MKDNKKKFSIGDLVKAQKGLFNDETKGGYGIILEMGIYGIGIQRNLKKSWASIRWPDGTNTKILEHTQGWAQTEVVARA